MRQIKRFGSRAWGVAGAGLIVCMTVFPAYAQQATAYLSVDSIAVGQRVELSLVVDRPVNAQVLLPEQTGGPVDSTTQNLLIGDLELIRRKAREERQLSVPGFRRDSIVYEVTTFAIDTAFVPPIQIPLVSEGDTTLVHAQAFFVPVASLVPPDAADIHELAPLASFRLLVWQWLLLGAVCLMLGGMVVYYFRHRPVADPVATAAEVEPDASPFQEALQRLGRIEHVDLDHAARIKPYYVELSETLRTYLERRLGVPALEQTTRELVGDLRLQARRGRVQPGTPDEVEKVLKLADFAKFADARPPAEDGKKALELTRAAVQTLETHWAPVEEARVSENGQAESPALTVEVPAWRKYAPAWAAVVVAALALGSYGGMAAGIPIAMAASLFIGARTLAEPDRRPFLPAFSLIGGLYINYLAIYVMAPEQVAVPLLASADMLAVVGGLGWLIARPGWRPCLFLGAVQVASLALAGRFLISAELPLEPALVVQIIWRLASLLALGVGAWVFSRNREAMQ